MLLLSENKDYRYYAVEVPIDANHITRERTCDGQYYIAYAVPLLKSNWNVDKWVKVGNKEKIEILGVIGNGEEISEEIAAEVLGNDKCKVGLNSDFLLKFRLKEKGILTYNPIPKPRFSIIRYTDTFEFKQWQEYESKLVKSVIIKVKK